MAKAKIRIDGCDYLVVCPSCGDTASIGAYGAAHLGTCELVGSCKKCGAKTVIPKKNYMEKEENSKAKRVAEIHLGKK